jgi:chromosome transmission fidelity protein 18
MRAETTIELCLVSKSRSTLNRRLTSPECFTHYPNRPIQDDNFLSKPNIANDWLHFYDILSSQLTSSQDWELAPYMSSPVLAFHHLFASSATARSSYLSNTAAKAGDDDTVAPFSGPSAPYAVSEALKANTAATANLRMGLSLPLARMYRCHASIATELLPYMLRLLAPDVKPVIINASTGNGKSAPTASVRRADEKERLARAVECMAATGVRFVRSKVDFEGPRSNAGWVYRMEPSLDGLGSFETWKGKCEPVRFAVRQLLEGEWRKRAAMRNAGLESKSEAKDEEQINPIKPKGAKRDFFGRVVETEPLGLSAIPVSAAPNRGRIWVSFHEGFSNAVRRPITLQELLQGF